MSSLFRQDWRKDKSFACGKYSGTNVLFTEKKCSNVIFVPTRLQGRTKALHVGNTQALMYHSQRENVQISSLSRPDYKKGQKLCMWEIPRHWCTIHREKMLKCHLCLEKTARNDKSIACAKFSGTDVLYTERKHSNVIFVPTRLHERTKPFHVGNTQALMYYSQRENVQMSSLSRQDCTKGQKLCMWEILRHWCTIHREKMFKCHLCPNKTARKDKSFACEKYSGTDVLFTERKSSNVIFVWTRLQEMTKAFHVRNTQALMYYSERENVQMSSLSWQDCMKGQKLCMSEILRHWCTIHREKMFKCHLCPDNTARKDKSSPCGKYSGTDVLFTERKCSNVIFVPTRLQERTKALHVGNTQALMYYSQRENVQMSSLSRQDCKKGQKLCMWEILRHWCTIHREKTSKYHVSPDKTARKDKSFACGKYSATDVLFTERKCSIVIFVRTRLQEMTKALHLRNTQALMYYSQRENVQMSSLSRQDCMKGQKLCMSEILRHWCTIHREKMFKCHRCPDKTARKDKSSPCGKYSGTDVLFTERKCSNVIFVPTRLQERTKALHEGNTQALIYYSQTENVQISSLSRQDCKKRQKLCMWEILRHWCTIHREKMFKCHLCPDKTARKDKSFACRKYSGTDVLFTERKHSNVIFVLTRLQERIKALHVGNT